jgi:antibiotic biosynthesis monooxygenase (ABM) superfamily enzyme
VPLKERLLLAFFIWLGVYPSVLLMSWLVGQVSVDPPLPVKVFFTTIVTVPTIEFLFLKRAKRITAEVEKELGIDGELREEGG